MGKTLEPKLPADYPLYAHNGSGQWSKRIDGKLIYFGRVSEPQLALERYENLCAGRGKFTHAELAAVTAKDGIVIETAANEFLTDKLHRVESGELSRRSLNDLTSTCERIIRVLGAETVVAKLTADDLSKLRRDISKTRGLVATTTELRRCKTFFLWLYNHDRISVPLKIKAPLAAPSKAVLRKERNSKPKKLFAASEVRKLLQVASVPMRGMILLGINAALGNTDCALMTEHAIDFDSRWLVYPRSKTGAKRKALLWPETIAAVKDAIAKRPKVRSDDATGLVFVTRFGVPFVRLRPNGTYIDCVSNEFADLLKVTEIKQPGERSGLGFYALRHSFETIAGATLDQAGVDTIMGHAEDSDDMSAVYREEVGDDRLIRISNAVRAWLWPAGSEAEQIKVDAEALRLDVTGALAGGKPKATRKKKTQAK